MAGGRKGTFSGGRIEIFGLTEIVRKLDRAGARVNSSVESALRASIVPVEDDLKAFMKRHLEGQPTPSTQKTAPRGVGEAESSRYRKINWSRGGNVLNVEVGYDKSRGGLHALFLDVGTKDSVGTPLIKPTFFVYYAVNNNLNRIHRIQVDTLNDIFRELT